MLYKSAKNKEVKIFNDTFVSNNMKRAKMIINNKQYKIKENTQNLIQSVKIKINFLDNIINLNSMFSNCESLYSIHDFKNLNTKYIKTIYNLFAGCNSLIYIDDISNWNLNNINNIRKIFYQCSSLKSLPNISIWNINKVNDISELFAGCSLVKELPDISKWSTSNANNMSKLFYKCSQIINLSHSKYIYKKKLYIIKFSI